MHDDQFRIILNHFGLSWDGYRRVRKGAKKRINRHMQYCGCHTVNAYLMKLDQNRSLKGECERLLTVSISRFFRDRQLWAALETSILPESIKHVNNKVKIWSAGCACGEEVYSVKIMWDKFEKKCRNPPALEVTATDINPAYLENAVTGIYTPSSLKDVNPTDVSHYFIKVKGQKRFRVIDRLRTHISWNLLDFRYEALEEEYHIIFLRNNILTYYLDPLKVNTFHKVLNYLAPSGILIIGSHEVLPSSIKTLEPITPFTYVFKKVSVECGYAQSPGCVQE